MALRYAVGASPMTWDANTGTKWSTTSGGAGGSNPPTANDDVIIDANSPAVINVSGARVCRSLVTTAAKTLGSTGSISIGTSTVNGTTALSIDATTTWSLSGSITFVSTNATQLDITTNGKTLAAVTFNGAGGSWRLADSITCAAITLTAGSFDTNGQAVNGASFSSSNSNTRSLTLGSSTVTLSGGWVVNNATNLTLSAASSTIIQTGSSSSFAHGSVSSTSATFGALTMSGASVATLAAYTGSSFTTLTRTGTAASTNELVVNYNISVTTPVFTGNNAGANRLLVRSDTFATPRTITSTNAWTSCANVDFMDFVAAGAGSANISAITGLSGDAGGNSGFTFTSPATQTLSSNTAGNWSTRSWSGRMPLPQDDWTITAAFSGQTITVDTARLGKNGTWASSTGSAIWALSASAKASYGSLTLRSGMTTSGVGAFNFNARSGSYTLTTGGVTLTSPLVFVGGSGSNWGLGDALTTSNTITLGAGFAGLDSWNTNNFSITCTTFNVGFGVVLNIGSSTVSVTSTAATTAWSSASGAFTTINPGTSNIVISTASANTRIFAGGGKNYSTLTYTVTGSTGILTLSGDNSFSGGWNFSDSTNARLIKLTAGSNNTISTAVGLAISGSSGKLTTFDTTVAASPATITVSSGTVSADYLSLQDNTAAGSVPFYAGANSTDVSGNTNWIFSSPPSGNFLMFM